MKRVLALLLAAIMCITCAAAGAESLNVTVKVNQNQTTVVPARPESVELPGGFQAIPWEEAVSPNLPHAECYLPDNGGYHDDSIDIRVESFRDYDTTIMAVYITLTDVSQLRTSMAGRYPSKSETPVHTLARRAQAVAAINGDYVSFHDDGIVVRNGVLYRNKPNINRDTLIIDWNGDVTILSPTTKEAWEHLMSSALHAFCFGPGLVVDGKVLDDVTDLKLNQGKDRKTQRIAFCQLDHLQYLVLATEGPENKGSVGLTLLEMAELCGKMGVTNAYNLDGGSSSTVVLDNKKINSLSSGKVRPVGDCIWFATLVP